MKRNVETMRAMKDGMTNVAAVAQSEAAYAQVVASTGYPSSIREAENALHAFKTRQAPQAIKRSTLEEQQLPTILCWRTFAAIIQSSGREKPPK